MSAMVVDAEGIERPGPAPDVAVVMVVSDEPFHRLSRALAAVERQRGTGPIDVVIAAPPAEHEHLARLRPRGAVERIRLVANPGGGRSAGLNAAVGVTGADVVVRVDARSSVPDDYVARCLARLMTDRSVGVVGGVQWPVPVRDSRRGRGVARALRNPWLLGNADYRRLDRNGPTDTVYLGAFRRTELEMLGGYEDALDANEDFDLCARYRDTDRVVWLEEDLVVGYEPRESPVSLFRQYRAFGEAKVSFWRSTGRRPNRRQQVALGTGLAGGALVLASLRRPRRLAAILLAGVAGIAVLDHVAEPAERDLRVRAHACTTGTVVVTGWLSGIATGVARRGAPARAVRGR